MLPGLAGVEDERARFYFDLVMCSLNDAARAALEALMRSGTYEYQREFARRIAACTELEQLKRWLRQSVSIRSVQELFESAST